MKVYKEVKISYGHMLDGEPLCGRMHGHNGRVEVIVEGEINTSTGMVINFNKISEVVKALDHKFILPLWKAKDAKADSDSVGFDMVDENGVSREYSLYLRDVYFLKSLIMEEATAENIAVEIAKEIFDSLGFLGIVTVKLWETDSSYAEVVYDGKMFQK